MGKVLGEKKDWLFIAEIKREFNLTRNQIIQGRLRGLLHWGRMREPDNRLLFLRRDVELNLATLRLFSPEGESQTEKEYRQSHDWVDLWAAVESKNIDNCLYQGDNKFVLEPTVESLARKMREQCEKNKEQRLKEEEKRQRDQIMLQISPLRFMEEKATPYRLGDGTPCEGATYCGSDRCNRFSRCEKDKFILVHQRDVDELNCERDRNIAKARRFERESSR